MTTNPAPTALEESVDYMRGFDSGYAKGLLNGEALGRLSKAAPTAEPKPDAYAYSFGEARRIAYCDGAPVLPDGTLLYAIPDTHVLVPRDPTETMIESVRNFSGRGGYSLQRGDEFIEAWADAIAAAKGATT